MAVTDNWFILWHVLSSYDACRKLGEHERGKELIEVTTYLSTLPVFPGVSKFFIKSPGLTMQGFLDKMQGFLDVSRFWNSGG